MLGRLPARKRRTVAADKGYDTKQFVAEVRAKSRRTPLSGGTSKLEEISDQRADLLQNNSTNVHSRRLDNPIDTDRRR